MKKQELKDVMDEFLEFCEDKNIEIDFYNVVFNKEEPCYWFAVTEKLFDCLINCMVIKNCIHQEVNGSFSDYKTGKFVFYFNSIPIKQLLSSKCSCVKLQGINEHLK